MKNNKTVKALAGVQRGARAIVLTGLMTTTAIVSMPAVYAGEDTQLAQILARLEKLENENKALRKELDSLKITEIKTSTEKAEVQTQAAEQTQAVQTAVQNFVGFNHSLTYDMLDPTTNINRKQDVLLQARKSGELKDNSLVLGGAVTAIADYWHSNTADKFGYLMRHPTANNQQQKDVSEAVLHSAQISVTATPLDWVTAYAELLYDPEQSFGAGTITSLTRNQIQLRKGYVVLGNLDKSPVYLTVGKMATPFGLTDTVSPFTASTVWHAFGGLAYGAMATYSDHGFNISLEAVQGGAQFRSANVPVNGTSVPSKLNNYVIDANYTFEFGEDGYAMFGGSYQKGTAYCQPFPVVHFNPCTEHNPAWAAYGQLHTGGFTLQGEYAATTDEWPGTFNPTPPLNVFDEHKVISWAIGGKYSMAVDDRRTDLSFEFSTFIAGPDGSPWERQNQWVLGLSHFISPSVKGFVELIQTDGYAPLNFISGGNLAPGVTHSDSDAESRGVILGINAAF